MKRNQKQRQKNRRYKRSSFSNLFLVSFALVAAFFIIVTGERENLDVQQRRIKWKEALTPLSKGTREYQAQGGWWVNRGRGGKQGAELLVWGSVSAEVLLTHREGSELNKPDLKKEKSRQSFWNRHGSPEFELSEGYSLYNIFAYKNHLAISIVDVKFPWLLWVLVKTKVDVPLSFFFFKLFSNYNYIFWQIPSISTVCFFRLPTIH